MYGDAAPLKHIKFRKPFSAWGADHYAVESLVFFIGIETEQQLEVTEQQCLIDDDR